jgi:cation:H+ antiporter
VVALHLLTGLALLWLGAEVFVRGSAAIALRLGLAPLAVGLTVVALGTSAPELGVSVEAALAGLGDVATGNVVGSNIANVGLILGIAALVRPIRVKARLLQVDVPVVLGASVLVGAFFLDGTLSRLEGGVLLALFFAYVWSSLRRAKREPVMLLLPAVGDGARRRPLPLVSALVVFGLAGLGLGSHVFILGAEELARVLGVSPALIGLTVVAVGTSLPELATSTVAAARDEGDIAVGNVIGSNIFNLFGILGVAALVRPLARDGVEMATFGVMLGLAVLLIPVMRSGFRIGRREGALLLSLYVGYLVWLAS